MSLPFYGKQPDGFTLKELLLSLTILGALLLLGLGAANRARQGAQATHCVSRLRELWSAWSVYSVESNGRLYQGTQTWITSMNATSSRVLQAPSQTMCPATTPQSADVYFLKLQNWLNEPIGYTANFYALYATPGVHHASQFTRLSTSPLFLDGKVYAISPAAWRNPQDRIARVAFRHNNRANVVYLDGHIEMKTPGEVLEIEASPF